MYEYYGICTEVIDGDTLELKLDLGFGVSFKERFRLLGINTPEVHGVKKDSLEYQEGLKASKRVKFLLTSTWGPPNKLRVVTNLDKKGKYGRYLATIYFDLEGEETNLNELLLTEGLASSVKY